MPPRCNLDATSSSDAVSDRKWVPKCPLKNRESAAARCPRCRTRLRYARAAFMKKWTQDGSAS